MKGRLNLTDNLLIGHDAIDDEHRHLVSLINISMDAIDDGANRLCAQTLKELIQQIEQHFKTEERVMYEFEFSEADVHADHHQGCLKKLYKIGSRCQIEECPGEECVLEIVGLLIDDLIGADLAFKVHLQAIGYRG